MGNIRFLTGNLALLIPPMPLSNLAVGFPLRHAFGVAAFVERGMAMLDGKRFVGHAVEKIAVVRDDHKALFVACKKILKPCQRCNIEVVGRLVQHQNIRFARELNRQRESGSLSSAERSDGLIALRFVKAESGENRRATGAEFQTAVPHVAVVQVGVFTNRRLIAALQRVGFQFRHPRLRRKQVGNGVNHPFQNRPAAVQGVKRVVLPQNPDGFSF